MAEPVPTWPEVAARGRGCLLVFPVGSHEQHGPHLPLDTDTRLVEALVDEVADLPFVMAAPALAYGASGEHAGFAGTLSIGTDVLADALVELVRSARGDFAGVAFVCAHGGNADGLTKAKDRSRAEGDRVFVWGARVDGGDAHAGRTETSLMMAIAPDAVRSGELRPGRTEALAELMPELREGGVRAVSETGVLGDPLLATAAEGRLLLGALVEELRAALESWWNDLQPAVEEVGS
ncbi:MAG: mycofactocin biosynthesis peptidyl-dipeptidase MftE [Acidimicrobiales bacterium]